MAVKANLLAELKLQQSGAADHGAPSLRNAMRIALEITDGVGANQADLAYLDERAVGDGGNDDIDLAGVLVDPFGNTITAAELVALFVVNKPILPTAAANTTDLTLGAATNPLVGFLGGTSPTIGPIKPGGFIMLAAGDLAGLGVVTAGTGDELRVANSAGAAATYQVGILARSA